MTRPGARTVSVTISPTKGAWLRRAGLPAWGELRGTTLVVSDAAAALTALDAYDMAERAAGRGAHMGARIARDTATAIRTEIDR